MLRWDKKMQQLKSKLLRHVVCVSLLFSTCFSEAAFSWKDNFFVNAGKKAASLTHSGVSACAKGVKFLCSKSLGAVKATGGFFAESWRRITFARFFKKIDKAMEDLFFERAKLRVKYFQAKRDKDYSLMSKFSSEIGKISVKIFVKSFSKLVVVFCSICFVTTLAITLGSVFLALILMIDDKLHRFNQKYRCQFCGNYLSKCTCDGEHKLKHAFSRRLNSSRVKKIIQNLDDINMTMHEQVQSWGGLLWISDGTLLHYVCYYDCYYGLGRFFNLIRWMVQERFANVNEVDVVTGHTPRQALLAMGLQNRVCDYLQDMEGRQQDLEARVANLADDFGKDRVDTPVLIGRFEEIKMLIESKETPGYAKQLAIPKLVRLHNRFAEVVSKDDLKGLYKHIAFNKTFLHRPVFVDAVRFAMQERLRDIDGKTVLVASAMCDELPGNTQRLIEENDSLYTREGLLKDWLATRPEPGTWKGFFAGLKKKIFGEKAANHDTYDDAKQDFIEALNTAKKHGKKKTFRDLANLSTAMDYLKEIETKDQGKTLPAEVAAQIVGFAGGDIGRERVYYEN